MSKFVPTGGFKWIDPKEFDLNKYTNIAQKDVFNIQKNYKNNSIIVF